MDQAEKLRNIVRAQEAETTGTGARMITVTSGKGGVGKSSVSVNLAVQIQKLGQRVIIFDADFGLANVEVMFGAVPKYNLSDVIFHGKQIEEIIVDGPMGIKFVTKENVRFLSSKLARLEAMADVIIVDTGAGISDTVIDFVKSSGEVLLVTTPEPTSITDSYALLKALARSENFDRKYTTIHLLANKADNVVEGKIVYNKLELVAEKFLDMRLNFLGYIPNDSYVMKAVMQQKPVSMLYENSRAAHAFKRLAERLVEGSAKETKRRKGISQVFFDLFKRADKSRF